MDCGVFAAFLFAGKESKLPIYLRNGGNKVNHRGFEAAGCSVLKDSQILTRRQEGLVSELFLKYGLESFRGRAGIVHTRYSTLGSSTIENALPYDGPEANDPSYSLAFNGNVANFEELKKELFSGGSHLFTTENDVEVLAALFSDAVLVKSLPERGRDLMNRVMGSYSLVQITKGRYPLEYARDPFGFMPLWLGMNSDGYFLASEDIALKSNGIIPIREVRPGEVGGINPEGTFPIQIMDLPQKSYCMFQFIYHMRPESHFAEISIRRARVRLGEKLAQRFFNITKGEFKIDSVVPIPMSGFGAAEGFINELNRIHFSNGLPPVNFEFGFYKDQLQIARNFLMPEEWLITESIKEKLSTIGEVFNNKNILIIDDSVVRGHTSRRIVSQVREAGAKRVVFVSSCPAIIEQCQYGIDFYRDELIAGKSPSQEYEALCQFVAANLNVDLFIYSTVEDLVEAIGLKDNLCLTCLTGQYPKGHQPILRIKEKTKGRP